MIYDPDKNKLFCKDFMVGLNLREDIFPEYPIVDGSNIKKSIRNMFEKWKCETD